MHVDLCPPAKLLPIPLHTPIQVTTVLMVIMLLFVDAFISTDCPSLTIKTNSFITA